jgi:hypothetical protein
MCGNPREMQIINVSDNFGYRTADEIAFDPLCVWGGSSQTKAIQRYDGKPPAFAGCCIETLLCWHGFARKSMKCGTILWE